MDNQIPEHDVMEVTYVASGNGAGELETVTYKRIELGEVGKHYLLFNGTSSGVELGKTYNIENVGDFVEVEFDMGTGAYGLSTHLGIFGDSTTNTQSHVAGFLSEGDLFSFRGADNTWVMWTCSLADLAQNKYLKIKLEATGENLATMYINGVAQLERAITLPFKVNNFGNSYSGYTVMKLGSVAIQSSQGNLSIEDPRKLPGTKVDTAERLEYLPTVNEYTVGTYSMTYDGNNSLISVTKS